MGSFNKSNKILTILIILLIASLLINLKFLLINDHEPKNFIPEMTENSADKNSEKYLRFRNSLILKDTSFYDGLKNYLSRTDSIDVNHGTKIQFEAKEDCYFLPDESFEITSDRKYIISTNYPSKFIAIFSETGKFIRKLGREGEGPGEYKSPKFVEIREDTIYCLDTELKKVLVYLVSGKHIKDYTFNEAIFPNEFKILPTANKLVLYNVFQLLQSHIISIYSFQPEGRLRCLGKFGKMKEINVISRTVHVPGVAVSDNNYIFALQPQRFGFTVFDQNGDQITEYYNRYTPKFLIPLKRINKNDAIDPDNAISIFAKHSRCRFIHYLGKGIIGLSVENPKKNWNDLKETIPFYYTFWKVDGEFIGYLKTNKRIVHGEKGNLYFWEEELKKNADGYYGNPQLVVIHLWKN